MIKVYLTKRVAIVLVEVLKYLVYCLWKVVCRDKKFSGKICRPRLHPTQPAEKYTAVGTIYKETCCYNLHSLPETNKENVFQLTSQSLFDR